MIIDGERRKMIRKLITALAVVSMLGVCVTPVNAASSWKHDGYGWWYEFDNGSYLTDVFLEIDGKTYCFDETGYMVTGWHTRPGSDDTELYYFNPDGSLGSCQWIGNQWVNTLGFLERDAWVDNYRYYVDSAGNWIASAGVRNTGWHKDAYGWWFDLGDGTYAADGLYEIDRGLYFFDKNGYMRTGWYEDEGYWYYLGNDGAMRQNQWVDGYYLGKYGYMYHSTWIGINSDAYVDKNGLKSGGWKKTSKGWWYDLGADGYAKNYAYYIQGETYQFDDQGYMVTGWYSEDDYTWFFYNNDGSMKRKAWEGNYWLDQDGVMARSAWVDGGKYYVDANGVWVPGKTH